MPNYRRARVPGGCYFFTVVTHRRARLFRDPRARALLGRFVRRCQLRWPFVINAIVLLPDHLHAIWTLPTGDEDYSRRWKWIKREFTRAWLAIGGKEQPVSDGRRRERRRGIWQPRFWEHTLETENDFERHLNCVHYNPVKHGLTECPRDWLWSSFHRWVNTGAYPENWACSQREDPPDFSDIDETVGE